MTVSYSGLSPGQVPDAVGLVREGFPEELLKLTVYGQWGINVFISDSLPRAGIQQPRRYRAAVEERSGKLLGFAEFVLSSGDSAHLSYIAVAKGARRRGIAEHLIFDFLSAHAQVERLTLDVFENNLGAKALYEKLGFADVRRGAWYVRGIPPDSAGGLIPVLNLPQALASKERFGFCSLSTESAGLLGDVGLLGDTVLKTDSARLFTDDLTLSGFRHAFPSLATVLLTQRALATEETSLPSPLVISVRMEALVRDMGRPAGWL